MLIDAGETKDNAVMNYLNGLDITRLDAVVATHLHDDHISEMPEVINNFDTVKTLKKHKQFLKLKKA